MNEEIEDFVALAGLKGNKQKTKTLVKNMSTSDQETVIYIFFRMSSYKWCHSTNYNRISSTMCNIQKTEIHKMEVSLYKPKPNNVYFILQSILCINKFYTIIYSYLQV